MPAKKGTRPPAAGKGRRKGVPNKATSTVREIFVHFVEHNAADAQVLYDKVAKKNPAKALEILAKVAEFVLPKLTRSEVKVTDVTPLSSEPIRDAAEAALVYARIIGNPLLDFTAITFEPPVLPVDAPAGTPVSDPLHDIGAEPPPQDAAPAPSNVTPILGNPTP